MTTDRESELAALEREYQRTLTEMREIEKRHKLRERAVSRRERIMFWVVLIAFVLVLLAPLIAKVFR